MLVGTTAATIPLIYPNNNPIQQSYHFYYERFHAWRFSTNNGERKNALFDSIVGNCIELNSSIGENLKFFPFFTINNFVSVEPNKRMIEYSYHESTGDYEIPNKLLSFYNTNSLDYLRSLPDNSVDNIVGEFFLSNINNINSNSTDSDMNSAINSNLNEICRVLKPDGKFYFIEHTQQQGALLSLIQNIVNPFYSVFTVGKQLNLPIAQILLHNSNFSAIAVESWPNHKLSNDSRKGIQIVTINTNTNTSTANTDANNNNNNQMSLNDFISNSSLSGLSSSSRSLIAGIAVKKSTTAAASSMVMASNQSESARLMNDIIKFGQFTAKPANKQK